MRRRLAVGWLMLTLAAAFFLLVQGCAMRHITIDKKVLAVGALTVGSAIVAAKADHDCRRTVGVGPCYGGYGPAKAEEGLRIGIAAFSVAMGAWWKKDYGKGWWIFPAGVTAWNGASAAQAWGKRCAPGKHLDLNDPFGQRYCE